MFTSTPATDAFWTIHELVLETLRRIHRRELREMEIYLVNKLFFAIFAEVYWQEAYWYDIVRAFPTFPQLSLPRPDWLELHEPCDDNYCTSTTDFTRGEWSRVFGITKLIKKLSFGDHYASCEPPPPFTAALLAITSPLPLFPTLNVLNLEFDDPPSEYIAFVKRIFSHSPLVDIHIIARDTTRGAAQVRELLHHTTRLRGSCKSLALNARQRIRPVCRDGLVSDFLRLVGQMRCLESVKLSGLRTSAIPNSAEWLPWPALKELCIMQTTPEAAAELFSSIILHPLPVKRLVLSEMLQHSDRSSLGNFKPLLASLAKACPDMEYIELGIWLSPPHIQADWSSLLELATCAGLKKICISGDYFGLTRETENRVAEATGAEIEVLWRQDENETINESQEGLAWGVQ